MRFPDDLPADVPAERSQNRWGVMRLLYGRRFAAQHGDHTIVAPSSPRSLSSMEAINPVMNMWRVPPPR
ncbi:hypothetical protein AB0395_38760 [Streptosporangium sp. NPDC051023]|uniref:hypothetical protein n=1 Tax=Streptosporangium sp. NPDC051023 TaxID=3155410 RepID=UPI00344C6965